MHGKKLTPAEIVIVASGTVAVLFSFFPFYSVGGHGPSAWSTGLFPVATLVPLFGLVMVAHILATRLGGARLPARLLDFTWEQIHVVLGVMAALLMVCYLIVNKGGASYGFGFFLLFLAAFGLAVGAFLLQRERAAVDSATGSSDLGATPASEGSSSPAPFTPPPPSTPPPSTPPPSTPPPLRPPG